MSANHRLPCGSAPLHRRMPRPVRSRSAFDVTSSSGRARRLPPLSRVERAGRPSRLGDGRVNFSGDLVDRESLTFRRVAGSTPRSAARRRRRGIISRPRPAGSRHDAGGLTWRHLARADPGAFTARIAVRDADLSSSPPSETRHEGLLDDLTSRVLDLMGCIVNEQILGGGDLRRGLKLHLGIRTGSDHRRRIFRRSSSRSRSGPTPPISYPVDACGCGDR